MPETSEINESLSTLENELTKLKSATDEIEKAREVAQSSILESKDVLAQTMTDLESQISAFSTQVQAYKQLSEELLSGAHENNEKVIKETKILHEASLALDKDVERLMEKIDKIDFPARLDKLDTAVTGINTAIQNLFGRFETVERNLKDELQGKTDKLGQAVTTSEENLRKDLLEGLKQTYDEAEVGFEKFKTRNLIFFIASLVVSLGSLVILLIKFVF